MKRVALTGGPAGGKSTAIRHLEANHDGIVAITPEVATMLLQGGFPTPSEKYPWTPEWQRSFQLAIAITQTAIEQVVDYRAQKDGKKVTIHDRALADGAAYLNGGLNELAGIVGQTKEQILGRYSMVIHLPTSAGQQIGYQKHTNEHRLEEADEALALEQKTLEVWQDHHNRHIINIEDHKERNTIIAQTILDHIQE